MKNNYFFSPSENQLPESSVNNAFAFGMFECNDLHATYEEFIISLILPDNSNITLPG
jgi:hypothetical protein